MELGNRNQRTFRAKYPELVNKLVLYAPIVAGVGDYPETDPFHANDWVHAAADFQKTADGSIDYTLIEPAVANTVLANEALDTLAKGELKVIHGAAHTVIIENPTIKNSGKTSLLS